MLHLLDADSDFQTRRMATALAKEPPRIVGRHIHQIILAAREIRKSEAIHAWGPRSLLAARLAGVRPIYYTGRRHHLARWLQRDIQFMPDVTPPAVISPTGQNSAARRKLNLSEDDFVVLAPGETDRRAGHYLALWTLAVLHESDQRWKLLLWGRGKEANAMRKLARDLGRPKMLRVAPKMEFESLLTIADMALLTPQIPAATMALGLCMTGGLPIVSTAHTPLVDGKNALLAPPAPRALAQRLLQLKENPAIVKSLVEAAKADGANYFSTDRFVERYRQIYATRPGS